MKQFYYYKFGEFVMLPWEQTGPNIYIYANEKGTFKSDTRSTKFRETWDILYNSLGKYYPEFHLSMLSSENINRLWD